MNEPNIKKEFDKRAKSLKLDEQAKEELFNKFLTCWNLKEFRCFYCKRRMELHYESEYSFTIDHYLARSKGGKDTPDNLVFCCRDCNFLKGNRSAENYLKNMERLIARKKKKEYWKARKASMKDKGLRDSYEQIFQHVKAKREGQ